MARFRFGKSIHTQLMESGFKKVALDKSDTLEDVLDAIKVTVDIQNERGNKLSEVNVFELELYIAPNYALGIGKTGYFIYYREMRGR